MSTSNPEEHVRRVLFLMTAAVGLATVGCGGGDGKAVSPTAPEFKQPNVKPGGKPVGLQ